MHQSVTSHLYLDAFTVIVCDVDLDTAKCVICDAQHEEAVNLEVL